MDPYRITYLARSAATPGSLASVFEEANRLAARGHDVHIVTDGVKPAWHTLEVPHLGVPALDAASAPLASAIPESDFVVGTCWRTAAIAHAVRRGLPIHLCRRYEGTAAGADARAEIDTAFSLPTLKIATGSHLQRLIQERFGSRCWRVRGAIDAAKFDPTHEPDLGRHTTSPEPRNAFTPRPWRVLIVGSDETPRNGLAYAVEAVDALKASGAPIELVRIAPGDPPPDDESTTVDRWLGSVVPASMPAVLQHVDILLGTTCDEGEGFDYAAAEAMAAGVPTVLTDVPAHHVYAPGDRHAIFVPPRDPAAMAEAITRLLDEPVLREQLSLAGRRVAAGLDWDTRLDRLEAVLAEIESGYRPSYVISHGFAAPGSSLPLSTVLARGRYEFAAEMAEGHRVVDVGCGDGHGSYILAEGGACSVVGLDRSELAIGYARKRHAHPRASYMVMDAEELALANASADLVVAFDVLDEMEDPAAFVSRVMPVLTERGTLLTSLDTRRDETNSPGLHDDRSAAIEKLRSTLEGFFGKVVLFGQSIEDGRLVIRGDRVDPRRDHAVVVMAAQPQRISVDDTAPAPSPTSRSRRSRRAA